MIEETNYRLDGRTEKILWKVSLILIQKGFFYFIHCLKILCFQDNAAQIRISDNDSFKNILKYSNYFKQSENGLWNRIYFLILKVKEFDKLQNHIIEYLALEEYKNFKKFIKIKKVPIKGLFQDVFKINI